MADRKQGAGLSSGSSAAVLKAHTQVNWLKNSPGTTDSCPFVHDFLWRHCTITHSFIFTAVALP